MKALEQFFLLDGHAIAYRHFFALRVDHFSTSAGEPTNAIFGFARLLLDILRKEKPKYLAVSFDRGMSGREEFFPDYKGTREKMPDELAVQLPRIEQLVRAFNIPLLVLDDYEADDLIGTVCAQVAQQNEIRSRIVTGDRDLLQLVSNRVVVQLPQRGGPDRLYDVAAFREHYELEPDQLVDLKALMGDSSDNIPGVRGIGQKTATKLLQQYGNLSGIYENLEGITGTNQEKLVVGREDAFLSYKLAKIRCDLPFTVDLAASLAHEYDFETVLALFRELEFRSLTRILLDSQKEREKDGQLNMFSAPQPKKEQQESTHDHYQTAEASVETRVIQDESSLDRLVADLQLAKSIAWDVESTGVDPVAADLVGISLASGPDIAHYLPLGHDEGEQLPLEMVIAKLRPVLTNPRIAKIAYNANYDYLMLARYGIHVQPISFDVMLAEWCINPAGKYSSPTGLKALAMHRLSIHMTDIKELLGSGRNQLTMNQIAISEAAPYAAADAAMTYRLWQMIAPELKQARVHALFTDLEMPLIPVVAGMELTGVELDCEYLQDMSEQLGSDLANLREEIYSQNIDQTPFNINSPKQLNEILFQKLGLSSKGIRRTTHGYSTDAASLELLRDQHPIVNLILQYREIAKLKSTYVDALPTLVNEKTGRLHTSFNQAGATTGRFSSSHPNLQNIPIRSELGRQVRQSFQAGKGRLLLAVDYNQIELRVLAHISKDRALMTAFHDGQDIHRATASAVFDLPISEIDAKQRDLAKRVNFGLMYGMGANRLARESQMTFAEADEFIQRYFERLPHVRSYIQETQRQARDTGELRTLFGRLGDFGALKRPGVNRNHVQSLLRVAINFPIQGSAADIMKMSMLAVDKTIREHELDANMILQVHDELVFNLAERELERAKMLLVETMENVCDLKVPLRVDAEYGPNWYDMQAF